MIIREATEADFDAVWRIFEPIVRQGDTYAIPVDINKQAAFDWWMNKPRRTFVAEIDGSIQGTYKLSANHAGPADHIANCGYMVDATARGRGVASAMCEHSQIEAQKLGFKAMQFNKVVSTNTGAVRLWEKHGFQIIGTAPKSFRHPEHGFVDAHIMYKWLAD